MVWQLYSWTILVALSYARNHSRQENMYNIPPENIVLPDSLQIPCSSNLAGLIRCIELQRTRNANEESERCNTSKQRHHGARKPDGDILKLFKILSSDVRKERRGGNRGSLCAKRREKEDMMDKIFRRITDNGDEALSETNHIEAEGADGSMRRYCKHRRCGKGHYKETERDESRIYSVDTGNNGNGMDPRQQEYSYYNNQPNNKQSYGFTGQNWNTHPPSQNPEININGCVTDNDNIKKKIRFPNKIQETNPQQYTTIPLQSTQGDTYGIKAAQQQAFQVVTPQAASYLPAQQATTAYTLAQQQPTTAYTVPQQQPTAMGYPGLQQPPVACQEPGGCMTEDISSESEEKPNKAKKVEIKCMCTDSNGTLKKCKCKKS
ncbi:hypothetical protein PAEPH01_2535 [Pancytospora epiphaga]|nr:hypothetical protein PAEPH01_2535 [Pancytospora epiphaga]